MNTSQITPAAPATAVRIPANYATVKRLGNWTTERQFQVRAHRGSAVLDLRSPQIPAGDIEIEVDIDHAMLKLLVADDAMVDDWDLGRTGRSRSAIVAATPRRATPAPNQHTAGHRPVEKRAAATAEPTAPPAK